MTLYLNFKQAEPNAVEPRRFDDGSAGYDLFSFNEEILKPYAIREVDTGIQLEMQGPYYGDIKNKWSVFKKRKLRVVAGVIDAGYRGRVFVVIHNISNEKKVIQPGEKIAQIVFTPILLPKLVRKDELVVDEESTVWHLNFTQLDPNALEPVRFDEGSAGYDVFSLNLEIVKPHEIREIDTGIELEMRGPFYGNLRDKSGVVLKKKLNVVEGVLDSGYRGSLYVTVHNLSNVEQVIQPKEKIAQIIFTPILLPKLVKKNEIDMCTVRGVRRFGNIADLCNVE